VSESSVSQPPPGLRGRRLQNMRERLRDFPGFLDRLNREYGAIASYQLPSMNCCAVFDADLIREVLVDKREFFPKGEIFEISRKFITQPAVFTSDGEDHERRRRLMAPAFSGEQLAAYAEIMVENARALRANWRPGQTVDIAAETYRVARRTAFGVFFGRDRQDDEEIGDRAVRGIKWDIALGFLPLAPLLRRLPLPPSVRAARACAALDEIVFEAIERARGSSTDGADLTSVLVRGRDAEGLAVPLADDEIRNEIYVLLLANFDPMAASLAWAIDYISRHPAVRDRLEEEADTVLGGRPVTAADYERLPYTRAVFLEAGRLTPPNYFFDRVAADDCVVGDYLIEKGTVVQPCFSVCHRQEKHWPDAQEFRPERWLDATESRCPEHAFLLFSHGPRDCLGRDFATMLGVFVLASIAQRWRLEPVSGKPPRADGKLVYVVKGAFPMVARERRPLQQPGTVSAGV